MERPVSAEQIQLWDENVYVDDGTAVEEGAAEGAAIGGGKEVGKGTGAWQLTLARVWEALEADRLDSQAQAQLDGDAVRARPSVRVMLSLSQSMEWIASRAGAVKGVGASAGEEPVAKRAKVSAAGGAGGGAGGDGAAGGARVDALVTGSLYMVGGCLEELTKLGVTNHAC